MKNKTILVIVAHPDDETIGMGGTIALHSEKGDDVFCLSLCDGVSARDNHTDDQLKIRNKAAQTTADRLKFKWLKSPNFKDNCLDAISLISVIKSIEKIKEKIKPDIIYTHSQADLNIDHRIVNQATLTAFRPQSNELCSEIRLMEVSSATDYSFGKINGLFEPNLFISIKDVWDLKLKALESYSMEIRDYPHTRSYDGIKNLAKYRGNQVGLDMAEAFEIVRKIKR